MSGTYRHYFNIDPEYFPQVNEAIIKTKPDIWKKYYPHETFVKLIKDTINVLSRKQRLSIWVEGAYGTGKSYAVLTLKKLLDATEEETREYFERYPEQLSNDLFNQFQRVKDGPEKIITVHKYGSSSIVGDNRLVSAIQESIVEALKEQGIENAGIETLKEAIIKWLSEPFAEKAFPELLKANAQLFGGDDLPGIINKLKTYSGDSLISLMSNIIKVGEENGIKAFTLDVKGLVEWIKAVIQENKLKAIVFIWDEFTNYFEQNLKSLTGFQELAEISATDPFYFIIVTHKSSGLFNDTDPYAKRILDRFVHPTCNISLPENMAFQLMGAAMVKTEDAVVLDEWNAYAGDLYSRTNDSRQRVKTKANITDDELKNILPIHPYAALLLKHISSAFDSNQRSMFDFIKNDRGDEIKGFQWFIDNYGPLDDNPLLTIDMLWDFFYEKGKDYLSSDIRSILDNFSLSLPKKLTTDEQRVLKTVLLLQAISQRMGNSVELFYPDDRNLKNAFEGSDLDQAAVKIAEKLCRDEILYKKPLGPNKFQFSAMGNAGDMTEIARLKEEISKYSTAQIIQEGKIEELFLLEGALKLRYERRIVSTDNIVTVSNELRNKDYNSQGKIPLVIACAKDDAESAAVGKQIENLVSKADSYKMVFVDASVTPLGRDLLDQYSEAMANSKYYRGKDNSLATKYEENARDVLKKWKDKLGTGEYIISYHFDGNSKNKERYSSIDQLKEVLFEIDKESYPSSLETGSKVIESMWQPTSIPLGVECGASETVKSSFKTNNKELSLENYIGEDVWNKNGINYWSVFPHLLISKIKAKVDQVIEEGFKNEGRISMDDIYSSLMNKPFGLLPCNLTAFVLGFVLKEYIDGSYSWSDGINSDVLNLQHVKDMVSEVLKNQIAANQRHREKYIVKLSSEEKEFIRISSLIFDVPTNQCTNIEVTRDRIRTSMKGYPFPIWTLKYVDSINSCTTDAGTIAELIDLYVGIANNQNIPGAKTDNEIAKEIGKLSIDNKDVATDLKNLLTVNNSISGMKKYIEDFSSGELVKLSEEVNDNGQYINVVKAKFNADAANWVWSQNTADELIKDVILEYQIISKSNSIIVRTSSYSEALTEWKNRCDQIKVAFQAVKNDIDSDVLRNLLNSLYELKKTGDIPQLKKKEFLNILELGEDEFKKFYFEDGQLTLFKDVFSFYITQYGFDDNEIKELFAGLPSDSFIKDKGAYHTLVDKEAKEFSSSRRINVLKTLWKDKTGTSSPREWSDKYEMPVICMVPENQYLEAEKAFGTIDRKNPDPAEVDKAITYLENASFFENLKDEDKRNEAFKNRVLGKFDIVLDVREAKDHLLKTIAAEPNDWFGLPEVKKSLEKMAEAKYVQTGYQEAKIIIDDMEASEVKRYLSELIKDNITVGIEIIRNGRK